MSNLQTVTAADRDNVKTSTAAFYALLRAIESDRRVEYQAEQSEKTERKNQMKKWLGTSAVIETALRAVQYPLTSSRDISGMTPHLQVLFCMIAEKVNANPEKFEEFAKLAKIHNDQKWGRAA